MKHIPVWVVNMWVYGYSVCVKGFSKQELRVEENKHGKLQRKEEA